MKLITYPNDPAQPTIEQTYDGDYKWNTVAGLTKREHFTAMAMQGFLSASVDVIRAGQLDNATVAKHAVNLADALIEALNKEEQ